MVVVFLKIVIIQIKDCFVPSYYSEISDYQWIKSCRIQIKLVQLTNILDRLVLHHESSSIIQRNSLKYPQQSTTTTAAATTAGIYRFPCFLFINLSIIHFRCKKYRAMFEYSVSVSWYPNTIFIATKSSGQTLTKPQYMGQCAFPIESIQTGRDGYSNDNEQSGSNSKRMRYV